MIYIFKYICWYFHDRYACMETVEYWQNIVQFEYLLIAPQAKLGGILWRILASWLASEHKLFEHFKCLFFTIKHQVCVKTLFMVIEFWPFSKQILVGCHWRWNDSLCSFMQIIRTDTNLHLDIVTQTSLCETFQISSIHVIVVNLN